MAWPGIETINLDLCVEIKNYIATSDNRFLHREEKKNKPISCQGLCLMSFDDTFLGDKANQ